MRPACSKAKVGITPQAGARISVSPREAAVPVQTSSPGRKRRRFEFQMLQRNSDAFQQHRPGRDIDDWRRRGRSSTLDVCFANNPLVVVVLLSKKRAEFGTTRANRVVSLD